MSKETVVVTCAVIFDKDRFFVAQRPINKKHGGKWEFPGGKLRKDERLTDGLKRELWEELKVNVQVTVPMKCITMEYDDFIIELHPFVSKFTDSLPVALEHEQIGWFTVEELDHMDFTGADRLLIERIKKAGGAPAIGEQR